MVFGPTFQELYGYLLPEVQAKTFYYCLNMVYLL